MSTPAAEVSLRKLLVLLVGIVLIVAGVRGKLGASLAVFLTPEYLKDNNS